MQGKRIYLNKDNELYLREGEYGKHKDGNWYCRPPSFYTGSLAKHNVIENIDGTITVSPSILITQGSEEWHGYLENGIWRKC